MRHKPRRNSFARFLRAQKPGERELCKEDAAAFEWLGMRRVAQNMSRVRVWKRVFWHGAMIRKGVGHTVIGTSESEVQAKLAAAGLA